MLNNGHNKDQELYENYEDALFRLAVHRVAEKEGKQYIEEAEQIEDDSKFLPSKQAKEKFIKLLNAELKKKKAKKGHPYLKRGAIIIAAIIALFSLSLLTVDAFRAEVFNLILGINEKFTSLQGSDSGNQNNGHMIIDWKNAYVPTYIPDGYEISDIFNTDSLKSITFENKQNKNLNIFYTESASTSNLEMDTENATTFRTITINGNKGMLIIKNDMVSVAWIMDNRTFTTNGQVDEKLLIKIAENVKYVK